jgi:hypothetical protein
MAGKTATDNAPAEADPAPDLEGVALGPAMAVDGYAAAVAEAMAIGTQNAIAQQQKLALLAMSVMAKSVRLVLDGPGAAHDPDDLDPDLHSDKEP